MKKVILSLLFLVTLLLANDVSAYTSTNFRVDWKTIYVEIPINADFTQYERAFEVDVYVNERLQVEDVGYYVRVGVNGTSTGVISTNKVGSHKIDVSVLLEGYNGTSTNTITYNIVDYDGPQFSNSESSIVTRYGVKPDYTEFFEATDNSNEEVKITVDETFIDYNYIGEYPVIITAEDVNGKKTSISIIVYVVDTFAPRISLVKTLQLSIGKELNVSDFFYGYDDYDKVITNFINIESYDNTLLGQQTIYASLEDSSGNYVRSQFTLTIVDDAPPTIYFNTNDAKIDITSDLTYELFKSFIMYVDDDGCNIDVDDVKIDFSTVLNELGTYTVIYYVSDLVGNTSETRLYVRVVQLEGPQIYCKNIIVKSGESFDESTITNYITVYDQFDSTAANTLRVDLSGVNLAQEGIYVVLVSACNTSGIFTYETLLVTVEGSKLIDFTVYWPLSLIVLAPIGYYGYKLYQKKLNKKYSE